MLLRSRAAIFLPARQLSSLGNCSCLHKGPETSPAGEALPPCPRSYGESRTVGDNLDEKCYRQCSAVPGGIASPFPVRGSLCYPCTGHFHEIIGTRIAGSKKK